MKIFSGILIFIILTACQQKPKEHEKQVEIFNDTTILNTELKKKIDSVLIYSGNFNSAANKTKPLYLFDKLPPTKKERTMYQITFVDDVGMWMSRIYIDSSSLKILFTEVN